MARFYLFVDESGNMDFTRGRGATQHFALTSVALADCGVGAELTELRRRLAWDGRLLDRDFLHATEDEQDVRDEVFALLARHEFVIDATIFEKACVLPAWRRDKFQFYEHAWYSHLRRVGPRTTKPGDQLLVVSAAVGTGQLRKRFAAGVTSAVQMTMPRVEHRTAHWLCSSEPCLQVADYCSWALYRKWERADTRSYDLIAQNIRSEVLETRSSPQCY